MVFGLLLGAAIAAKAQTQSANPPMPPNTVLGRTGITPGPGQAIPFDALNRFLTGGSITYVSTVGAVGDGVTDDTVAIQTAINSLPPGGGIIAFSPGATYCITTPLTAGNGSQATGESKTQGIYLIAAGGSINQGGTASTYTSLKWCGGANGGALLTFNGPMHGWGISGLNFNCGGTGGITTGLKLTAVQFGLAQNLRWDSCVQSMWLASLTQPVPSGSEENAENNFINLQAFPANAPNAIGFLLTGDGSSNTSDTNLSTFTNAGAVMPASSNTMAVWYLQNADTNLFNNTGGFMQGANTTCFLLDYNGPGTLHQWPASNVFQATNCQGSAGVIAKNVGTPGGAAQPNYFYNFSEGNAGERVPLLANVGYPPFILGPGADVVSQSASLSSQILSPIIPIDGQPHTWEMCGYLEISATGASGGTVQWSTGWNDDTGTFQQHFSAALATTAKNFDSACVFIRMQSGGNIFWSGIVAGTMGTARYDFHARLKKLD